MSPSSGHTPLVWFTSLAVGGAGTIAASAWQAPSDLTSQAAGLATGTIALCAGLLVSLSHLGRTSRAPLAVRGVGRSSISHEIVLAGTTVAAALALLAMGRRAPSYPWIRLAAAAASVLFLLSIGLVYRLRGQRTWRGVTAVLPLTTGLVCGAVLLQAVGRASIWEDGLALWIIPVDAAAFIARWWTLTHAAFPLLPQRVDASRRHSLSAIRLLIFDVVPPVLLDMNVAGPAIVAVVLGLALDRYLFYALADPHTTEAEIARVEALIGRESRFR